MATKKEIDIVDLVESHKPKNFKYKYIFKNDEMIKDLTDKKYDIASLDTIQNDALIKAALDTEYQYSQREVVQKAKVPTLMDDGVILSKKMATKTDKKLQEVGTGYFEHNGLHYVAIRLKYEKFDILEIFILT